MSSGMFNLSTWVRICAANCFFDRKFGRRLKPNVQYSPPVSLPRKSHNSK